MASNITRGELAGHSITEDAGLEPFRSTLLEEHKITQIGVAEEGRHRLCSSFALGLLALLAAGGATWLFLRHGPTGFIAAYCLCGLSAGFVAAIVITVVVTSRRQQNLQEQLEEKMKGVVNFDEILLALENASETSIQNVLKGRPDLLRHVYTTYAAQQKLSPDQMKVFNALSNEPELINLVAEREPDFAWAMLHHPDANTCPALLKRLLVKVGAPESPEQLVILSLQLAAVQSYIGSLKSKPAIKYCRACLQQATKHTPLEMIKVLMFVPQSEKDALFMTTHFLKAVIARAKDDREFAVGMLCMLPPNSRPILLDHLFTVIGPPITPSGFEILKRHSTILANFMARDKAFALACTSYGENAKVPDTLEAPPCYDEDALQYAREPKAVARLPYRPYTIHMIFSKMTPQEQIKYLKELDRFCTSPDERTRSQGVVSYILEQLLTEEFMTQHDLTADYAIFSGFLELLQQFSRWPKQMAEALFGKADSFLSHLPFKDQFFRAAIPAKRELCVQHAVDLLSKQKDEHIQQTYFDWLTIEQSHDWLDQILLYNPGMLAKVLCRTEDDSIILKGVKMVSQLETAQTNIYAQKFVEHFIDYYEERLFDSKDVTPVIQERFFAQIHYLNENPQWVADNAEIAKRYFNLLCVSTEVQARPLQKSLMGKHRTLFDPIEICCNGEIVSIPAYRLVTLSYYFELTLSSDMKESRSKRINLTQPSIEPDVAAIFVHYLATSELLEGWQEHVLPLSFLAHQYTIGHLSSLCTAQIIELLKDPEAKTAILETIQQRDMPLWDVRCACFERFGHPNKNIKVSYNPGTPTVLNSKLCKQRYISTPMGNRQVKITHYVAQLAEINFDGLYSSFNPTTWSTGSPEITEALILLTHRNNKPALTRLFWECAAKQPRVKLDKLSDKILQIYTLAYQHERITLAQQYLKFILPCLNINNLADVLAGSLRDHLPDLTIVCLMKMSQLIKEGVELVKQFNLSPPTLEKKGDTIDLAVACAKLEITFTLEAERFHVIVPALTRDNEDLFKAIRALHGIRKIDQLHCKLLSDRTELQKALGSLKIPVAVAGSYVFGLGLTNGLVQ